MNRVKYELKYTYECREGIRLNFGTPLMSKNNNTAYWVKILL